MVSRFALALLLLCGAVQAAPVVEVTVQVIGTDTLSADTTYEFALSALVPGASYTTTDGKNQFTTISCRLVDAGGADPTKLIRLLVRFPASVRLTNKTAVFRPS